MRCAVTPGGRQYCRVRGLSRYRGKARVYVRCRYGDRRRRAGDGADQPRLSKAFLEDIDATWEEQGFNSRSEFLRYAARDAVKHPEFSRGGWKQIAASEHELRSGRGELVSREEVVEMMARGEDGE